MTDLELLHIITMPTRYQILAFVKSSLLWQGAFRKTGISESAVSQHLQVLKNLWPSYRSANRLPDALPGEQRPDAGHALQALSEVEKHTVGKSDCEFAASCSRRGDSRKS